VNFLTRFADDYPGLTYTAGTAGGGTAWLISLSQDLQVVLGIIGQCLGILVALSSLIAVVLNLIDRARGIARVQRKLADGQKLTVRERKLLQDAQAVTEAATEQAARNMQLRQPADVDDDIPMGCPGCDKAPPGWRCSRTRGHDGPCAAHPQ